MVNHSIKIPEKHYITFSSGRGEDAPLAFMTPYGTDSAAKKRMDTADRWAGGYGYHSTKKTIIEPKTVDNELLSGFKILTNVQRYSTSNVVWRILDPRGFELEISSGNMSMLLGLTTIENGEILTSCIWAREGANNILLSENDEEYKEAVINSKRIKKSVSMRDVKIGNEVLFQKGHTGTYMGKFYSIHLGYESDPDDPTGNPYGYSTRSSITINQMEVSNKSKHFFLIKGSTKGWNNGDKFMSISSPKISEILSQSELSINETEKMINDGFTSGTQAVADARGDTEYRFMGVSSSKVAVDQLEINLTELNEPRAFLDNRKNNAKSANLYYHGPALIGKYGDDWLIVSSDIFYDDHFKSVSGSIISMKILNESAKIKRTSSEKYSEYSQHQGTNDLTIALTDVIWYLPTVAISNAVTSNKFEMLLPTS